MVQATPLQGNPHMQSCFYHTIACLDGRLIFNNPPTHTHTHTQSGDVIQMPVPSSFNDITQNASLRDFVGWVWYDRQFWLPSSWSNNKNRIVLRFESAHYNTIAVSLLRAERSISIFLSPVDKWEPVCPTLWRPPAV